MTARILLLLSVLAGALGAAAQAHHATISPMLDAGASARAKKDYVSALDAYKNAREESQRLDEKIWEFRAYFYLGLTKQEQAEEIKDVAAADKLREEAEEYYEKALELNPRSSATLMNLADAEWANNDQKDAIERIEQGLALNDSRYVAFAIRLGGMHAERKDFARAAAAYRLAAEREPENSDHHLKTVEAYFGAKGGDAFASYLWNLLSANYVDRVLDVIARDIETRDSVVIPELPSLLASALAKKDYDKGAFATSETRIRLSRTIGETPYAKHWAAIEQLYLNTDLVKPDDFAVWRDASGAHPQRDAFRALAQSIGGTEYRRSQFGAAERYFSVALAFTGEQLDVSVLRDLASARAAQNDIDGVTALRRQYEPELEKQEDASSDLEEYYKYHRMIASIYAALPANDPRRDTNIEQLEHAISAASSYVEPGVYGRLALAYERQGRFDKSNPLRLAQAEAALRQGSANAARTGLAYVRFDQLDAAAKDVFNGFVDKTVTFSDDVLAPAATAEIKRNLIVLCEPTPRAERVRATRELQGMKIKADVKDRQLYLATPAGTKKIEFELPARAGDAKQPM